jgi:hypothetical protein
MMTSTRCEAGRGTGSTPGDGVDADPHTRCMTQDERRQSRMRPRRANRLFDPSGSGAEPLAGASRPRRRRGWRAPSGGDRTSPERAAT